METMIWDRERYIAHCNFEFTGREMFCELFGPLIGLDEEWRRQGASAKEIAMTAFDWDYVLKADLAGNCAAITDNTPRVLEDTPEYTISIDEMGRKMKLCKQSATIPLPLEYPVQTMEDWQKIKHWYEFREDRVNREALLEQKALRDKGYLMVLSVPGGFDEPRQLMGEEGLCIAAYEEPEIITDMLETIGNTCVQVMERIADIVPIDYLSIHEDMAGKSGPLFGPKQVREFMQPYYRKIWSCARAHGGKIFAQDSDGNMTPVVDAMLECGINCMFPCEPAAGMDIVALRKKYGNRLSFKGGIDKFALRKDFDAIRAELEYKMSAPMLGGGTVFGIDHRIPNGVPLENYRYYVETGRKLLGLPPVTGEGWGRMAF
ncbi:MAG: uroporphyrinogen decarboxylase family protein [Faecousia sp.]